MSYPSRPPYLHSIAGHWSTLLPGGCLFQRRSCGVMNYAEQWLLLTNQIERAGGLEAAIWLPISRPVSFGEPSILSLATRETINPFAYTSRSRTSETHVWGNCKRKTGSPRILSMRDI